MQWCRSVILALNRWSQKDNTFQLSLDNHRETLYQNQLQTLGNDWLMLLVSLRTSRRICTQCIRGKKHANTLPVHGCKVHAYVFHHSRAKTATCNSQPLKEFCGWILTCLSSSSDNKAIYKIPSLSEGYPTRGPGIHFHGQKLMQFIPESPS